MTKMTLREYYYKDFTKLRFAYFSYLVYLLSYRHDDLKEMLDSNKDSLKLEAMKRIVAVSNSLTCYTLIVWNKQYCFYHHHYDHLFFQTQGLKELADYKCPT